MNLSNRLTFSIIFSVLLVAAFALVPTAMAAEGGPAVESIVLDGSKTLGSEDDTNTTEVDESSTPTDTVSERKALLTRSGIVNTVTNTPRAALLDVDAAITAGLGDGNFRLIVTFDQDVYNANTAKPDAPNDPDTALHNQSATRIGIHAADDLANDDFTILSSIGIGNGTDVTNSVTVTNVTRVQTAGADTPADTADDEYSLRQFYVTITVANAALASLPINVAIVVNADAGVFGIGTNRQISPFKAAEVGLGNEGYVAPGNPQQPYTQYDFRVIARAVIGRTITKPASPIRSYEPLVITLNFDSELNPLDNPSRDNIIVTGGSIKENDDSTPDVDEGITQDATDKTIWTITIIPDGGVTKGVITVKSTIGSAFVLDESFDVDNTPPPTVSFTGTPIAGGDPFTVTIIYDRAPDTPLTAAGVTVTGGTKGAFATVSSTAFTIVVDPDDVAHGANAGTLTIAVGNDTKSFTIDPGAPDPTVSFTGTPVAGGASFTITIIYDRAPDVDLTAAGVTVTGGTKGTFTKVSSTAYTIVVDPDDVAAGATAGTFTIAVGDDTKSFTIDPGAATQTQSINFNGQTVSGGDPFTITIRYTIEPSVELTADGITVTGGTKGTFTKVSSTVYTIVVDPVDVAHGANPGTLTISVGQYTRDFTVNPAGTPPPSQITFTGTPVAGGEPFTVTITYDTAPASALTEAGVTVTGATKGTFTRVNDTTYTIEIDPTDVPFGTPAGTVEITVDTSSQTFTINPTGTNLVDPEEPVVITLGSALAGRGYLLVAHDGTLADGAVTSGLPTLPPGATLETVGDGSGVKNDMPNLYKFFYGGGTIAVYVKDSEADVVINEIMWARDENAVGSDREIMHQWIELYNNSDHIVTVDSITLQFTPKVAATTLDSAEFGTRRDRVSNRERVGAVTGWRITDGLGQNGNTHDTTRKDFISMYRLGTKLGNDDGVNKSNWRQSTEISHVNHLGTPGTENVLPQNPITSRTPPSTYTPPKSHVIINEVYNDSNNDLDWIELRFLQKTNMQNWKLSYVRDAYNEIQIMSFPNQKREFQAGDIVLIVNKDPQETPLAAGQDVTLGALNQARGAGPHKYWNPSNGNSSSPHYLDIPDHNGGNFMIILRSSTNNFRTRNGLHDAVGRASVTRRTLTANTVAFEQYTNFKQIWNTNAWPINGQNLRAHNAQGSSNTNAHLEPDRNFAVGRVYARNGTAHGWRKGGISRHYNRGGLGYDRNHEGDGTPGYPNDILKSKSTDLGGGTVVISELMLTTDSGRYPQWIELHNTSGNTVDLHADTDANGSRQGWSIRVEQHRSGTWDDRRRDKLHVEVKFRELGVRYIPPNQTILITADKVRNNDSRYFPNHRVASIWATSAKGKFEMLNRRDTFLNPNGFLLEIVDGNGRISDIVGNLDGNRPDLFDPDNVDFDDPFSWEWPNEMVDNRRTSLIRIYDDRVPRRGTPDRSVEGSTRGAVIPMGVNWRGNNDTPGTTGDKGIVHARYAEHAWVHASDTKMARAQITWYGHEDDFGTPGHTTSTPLPVTLSSFRPALENGQVVVRWTTESELDNAGFNVYRSDGVYAEFKQVNAELIQGAGTTGERTAYKWIDTTAKPDTVYYYQIEDVSFAGERQTLATTKLRGLVSAKNKLTTTWGDLKSQD